MLIWNRAFYKQVNIFLTNNLLVDNRVPQKLFLLMVKQNGETAVKIFIIV